MTVTDPVIVNEVPWDAVPLAVAEDRDNEWRWALRDDTGAPFDLTGRAYTATWRSNPAATAEHPFTVAVEFDVGEVVMTVASDAAATLPPLGVWELVESIDSQTEYPILRGPVRVLRSVQR